jgi:aspartyl-tRNA(Asn)/glutamyl-tRNA(Gln) amidotransferase subunit C
MLTADEVRHVAMLARLGLTDEEVEKLRVQMLDLLGYIDMLKQVDTSAIPPTAQILTHLNVMRPDEPRLLCWKKSKVTKNNRWIAKHMHI